MKKLTFFLGLAILAVLLSSSHAIADSHYIGDDPYRIDNESGVLDTLGSSTVLPVMEEAALRLDERNPGVTISTAGGGSGTGFSQLAQDAIDLAPMSRAPRDSEIAEVDFTVEQQQIGLDALTIIVHPDNPLNEINETTVSAIFVGNITTWSELGVDTSFIGGASDVITVYERAGGSGTHDYFNEEFLDEQEVDPNAVEYGGERVEQAALNNDVSNDVTAISYSGLAYVDNTVKALDYQGADQTSAVTPSIQAAADGSYAISRPLFLVWNGDEDIPLRDAFVDYILSPEGQYVVFVVGYVPLFDRAEGYSDLGGADDAPLSIIPAIGALLVIAAIPMIRRKN